MLFQPLIPNFGISGNNSVELTRSTELSLTTSDPIIIESNQDFVDLGFDGSGTEGDPYLVQRLSIVNNSECIFINGTDVYFEIIDCYISAPIEGGSEGIYLENVTNYEIRDCVTENHEYGIRIENSGPCQIINTTTNNNYYGIYLENTSKSTIVNSTSNKEWYGFYLSESSNSKIYNCTHNGNGWGIITFYSDDCIIANNTIEGTISFGYSKNATIGNNTVHNGGFEFHGQLYSFYRHEIGDNWVNNKPLGFFNDNLFLTIDASLYGQVIMFNCNWSTVEDGYLSDTHNGIDLIRCYYCVVDSNLFVDCDFAGIDTYYAYYCNFTNNYAVGCDVGFNLDYSYNIRIENNTAETCVDGIHIYGSNDITVLNNTLRENEEDGLFANTDPSYIHNNTILDNGLSGINLHFSFDCQVTGNLLFGNSKGILLNYGGSNQIYLNKFDGNTVRSAQDDSSSSSWDDGVSIGNWYYDYNGTGVYEIPGTAGSVDNYPRVFIDTTDPIINSPGNITHELANTEEVSWSVKDYHPDYYEIYNQSQLVQTDSWIDNSVVSIDISELDFGVYNFTIIIYDASGNYADDTIFVEVIDTTPPSISSPDDFSYEYGVLGNTIEWTVDDPKRDSYWITRNQTLIHSGEWLNDTIIIELAAPQVAIFNYTLILNDTSGNVNSSSVFVNVYENPPPTIDSPDDVSFELESVAKKIYWHPDDSTPDYYKVYKNDEEYSTKDWGGGTVSVVVDTRTLGNFTYRLEVYDVAGNMVSDSVNVTIFDASEPWVNDHENIEYTVGEFGNNIRWEASDNNLDYYEIYHNGALIQSEEYDGGWIDVNVDGLNEGVHTFYIYVYDEAGNFGFDVVTVNVLSAGSSPPPGGNDGTIPPVNLETLLLPLGIGIFVIIAIVVIARRKS